MGKIRPAKPPGGKIVPPKPEPMTHLTLSFKYFNHREPFVFPPHEEKPDYPLHLIGRLKDLCSMKPSELRASNSRALRSHPISWPDTTEPNGFDHLNNELQEQIVPWQFTITANEYGRIHGFWIDEVFYVVWIDPMHALYPER